MFSYRFIVIILSYNLMITLYFRRCLTMSEKKTSVLDSFYDSKYSVPLNYVY